MDTSFSSDPVEHVEDRVDAMLRRGRECLGDKVARCEERIAESPGKAVLIALGVGYLARSLPLGSILSIPLRVAAKVAPPLLLALGAAKAYEAIRCAGKPPEDEEPILDLFSQRAMSEE